jgi:5-dehydro-4-deoxyglucarate dehydratase
MAIALRFFNAHKAGDTKTTDALLQSFFFPYSSIRDRKPGYAVSIVKAGMRLTGRDTGPVRPPLTELDEEEHAMLARLLSDCAILSKVA